MKVGREELVRRRDRILQWISGQGVVFCFNPYYLDRLKEYLSTMPIIFPELVQCVAAIYVYQQEEQSDDLKEFDGISWDDKTSDSGMLHAIGISTSALDRGQEYAQLIFLHEFAHILCGGEHNCAFHDCLNDLIRRHNDAAGSRIVNDGFGRPMRCDTVAWVPPEIPGELEPQEGKVFRSGGVRVGGP